MKKFIIITLTIIMFSGLFILTPNLNLSVMAEDRGVLPFNTRSEGFLTDTNSSDRHTIILTEPGRVSININRSSDGGIPSSSFSGAYIRWLDANSVEINNAGVGSFIAGITFPYSESMDLEVGSYYFEIGRKSSGTGTYFIETSFTVAGVNINRPNNSIENAQLIMPGENVKGFISYQNRVDFYRFVLTEPGRVSININRSSDGGIPSNSFSGAYIRLLEVDGIEINRAGVGGFTAGITFPYIGDMGLLAIGTYYIEIGGKSNGTGTYFIETDFPNSITPTTTLSPLPTTTPEPPLPTTTPSPPIATTPEPTIAPPTTVAPPPPPPPEESPPPPQLPQTGVQNVKSILSIFGIAAGFTTIVVCILINKTNKKCITNKKI